MFRVGFIFPSSDYLFDPFRGDPHTHFQILTVLEQHFAGRVEVCLPDLRGIRREFAQYHIPECDVYLYSVYSLDFEELKSIVTLLRARYPASRHIGGGPHAALFPEECLKIYDSLIIGEGEYSVVRAVEDILSGAGLKPEYRQERPVDLNSFPFPRRKYLPASTVARPGLMTMKKKPGFDKLLSCTVMFSRGCPYSCSFCAIPYVKKFSPGIRYRRPGLIEEEIRYLMDEYGIRGISLLDEIAIPLRRDQAVAHLEAIGRTGVLWRGQTRVDALTPEIARLAKKSGCLTLSLGVESPSQRVLDIVNKNIRVERAKETIRLLKENDIECRVYLVSGLPGEPEDIVEQTVAFLEETRPDLVMISLFTVRPGTEMYEHPERYGISEVTSDFSNMMNLQNRYESEDVKLTFEYGRKTPWGAGFSRERIVRNFRELQKRIDEMGLGSVLYRGTGLTMACDEKEKN